MTTQTDYTPDEWTVVLSAPATAGMLVAGADPSLFGSVKESMGMVKAIIEYGASAKSEVVKAVAAAIQGGQKPQMPEIPKDKGPAGALDALVAHCVAAVNLVASKSPEEADDFKGLLVAVANRTAEASKEGGFLGIGAVRVSEQEKAAIAKLEEALGASAQA